MPFFRFLVTADTPNPFVNILYSRKLTLIFLFEFIKGIIIIGIHAKAPIILSTSDHISIKAPSL